MKYKYKIDYIVLGLLMTIYYGHIQWNNFLGDPDGFYHAKLAEWISQGIFIKSLPWMQFTTLQNNFTDHHLLYHIALAPFTDFFNPLIGVKIATVLFAVSMVLTFHWLLKKMSIAWPLVFSLSFLLLNGLNFRISLIKANSLSLLMIYLIIYALFSQKYKLSILLGFLFVWLYGGWPLAILILIVYIISEKIYYHLHNSKLKIFLNQTINTISPHTKKYKLLKISACLLVGLILGLVLNPYWPQNIYFYYQQFLQIGVINMGSQFTVGNEWYGTDIYKIIASSPHLFVAACLAVLILFFNIKKVSRFTWFSFFMSFGFLVLTAKSQRYVEYYMPFTLLFVASATNDIKKFINFKKYKKIWSGLPKKIQIYISTAFIILLILIIPFTYDKILSVRLSQKYPLNKFVGASNWLKKNTPKNSIVFHSDWDEWPILFYHNDQNFYIMGLDPTFMENYSPSLHKLYREITYGNINYQLSQYIKNDFAANYVFVDKDGHDKLINNLNLEDKAQIIYQDDQAIIYQLS